MKTFKLIVNGKVFSEYKTAEDAYKVFDAMVSKGRSPNVMKVSCDGEQVRRPVMLVEQGEDFATFSGVIL